MRDYQLAEHVHACITPKGTVFLDLDRDAYSGITFCQSQALGRAVEGWPAREAPWDARSHDTSDERFDTLAILASLCHAGVLVPREAPGHCHREIEQDEPTEELKTWRDMRPVRVHARDVLSFFRALLTALVMLRCRSMRAVAARAQRLATSQACTDAELARARELLTLYTYIRLFVFARRGRCLLDSLTLLEFLAARGVHVRWIVGVRARPFSAHCWLQHERWILNGTPRSFVASIRSWPPEGERRDSLPCHPLG